MKSIIGIVTLIVSMTPAPMSATGYRGAQAVLFMAWDDASVDKLIQTVAESQASLPSNRFELAALYITEGLPRHNDGSGRTRWDNLSRVIDCLATVPAPPAVRCPVMMTKAVDVKIRLFFDLHAFDGLTESDDLKILTKRAQDFDKQLLSKYGSRIVFRLSPLLEEKPQVAFPKFAQTLFGALSGEKICAPIYPRLIRSGYSTPGSVTVSVTCKPTDMHPTTKSIPVSNESHGKRPASGYDGWSNDGVFVYASGTDASNGTPNADGSVDAVDLTTFIQSANNFAGTSLLWRPRYNLMLYKTHDGRCVAKSPGGALAYCASTTQRGSIASRIAATNGAVFDTVEARVLARFLKGG